MSNKQIFNKYYSKLAWEGTIKSLIIGFIGGLSAGIISLVVAACVNNFNLSKLTGLWLLLGIAFGVALISAPLLYFAFFRPKTKQIAGRVDKLGLEERLTTMIELEKDESYIAKRQREDAKAKLAANRRPLKISILIAPIVIAAALFMFSGAMVAVSAAAFENPLAWNRPQDWEPEQYSYVLVKYDVLEENGYAGGYIEGEADQNVIFGKDSSMVVAVADPGYAFVGWDDGKASAQRIDTNVQEDKVCYAIFQKQDLGAPKPSDPGSKKPSDEKADDEPPNPDEEDKQYDWQYQPENQYYDGETYYRHNYPQYYEEAMRLIAEKGDDLTPEERAFIEKYAGLLL